MVQTYGITPSKYAPVNEKKGGTVSYSLDARQSVISKSRETAYKRMHDACKGPYRIVSEGGTSSGSMGIATEGYSSAVVSTFSSNEWLINFECEN